MAAYIGATSGAVAVSVSFKELVKVGEVAFGVRFVYYLLSSLGSEPHLLFVDGFPLLL